MQPLPQRPWHQSSQAIRWNSATPCLYLYSPSLPLAVVLETLVVLLDELLVARGEFFLDRAIDRVAILVAQSAPRALRSTARQSLHGVGIGPFAAAARGAALAPLPFLTLRLARLALLLTFAATS